MFNKNDLYQFNGAADDHAGTCFMLQKRALEKKKIFSINQKLSG